MRFNTLLFLSITFLALVVSSCKKDDDDTSSSSNNSNQLEIDVQNVNTSPPSKVSIFFRVKNRDGKPIAGLLQDDFTLYEKGRNDPEFKLISKDEADRILSDNEQVFDYKVMLLLDLSASVVNNDLEKLKAAAREFIIDVMQTNHNSSTKIGIWWFDGANFLHPLVDFTNNAVVLQEAISGINPELTTDNSTDLFGAIIKGTQLIEAQLIASTIQGFLAASSMIVFTDGTDQAARHSKQDAYDAVSNASENVNFYTIGLGAEIDETVLRNIGKNSSVFAEDSNSLTTKFEEIAQLIYDETNSFYLYEYCTPKRNGSGENDFKLEVSSDDWQGSTNGVFDATGFVSGCELY